MVLAKLAGRYVNLSQHATKVIKGGASGYRTPNGFYTKLTKVYDDAGAALTESSKRLEDGCRIKQKLWSWQDGSTIALTTKSNGFFSYVHKNADGKVVERIISNNPNHLVCDQTIHTGRGLYERVLKFVNGNKGTAIRNGKCIDVYDDSIRARNTIKSTIADTNQRFRCIG